MKRYLTLPVCTCSLIISLLARGQDLIPNAVAGLTSNLTISPTEAWVDTRIDLHPGDALQINARDFACNLKEKGHPRGAAHPLLPV